MQAVIFEVEMKPGREKDYFALASSLRPQLEAIDGFISVERFQSVASEGKYVSLSFWRDEQAVKSWREHAEHRIAQAQGKKTIIADFRIRVAEVVRDYTLADSRA